MKYLRQNTATTVSEGPFLDPDGVTAETALTITPAQRKLSAGWLIENLGLRGYRDGDAGVAESHALVLVNHGEATGEQIWQLAQFIRERVLGAYGVELEPEPIVV